MQAGLHLCFSHATMPGFLALKPVYFILFFSHYRYALLIRESIMSVLNEKKVIEYIAYYLHFQSKPLMILQNFEYFQSKPLMIRHGAN